MNKAQIKLIELHEELGSWRKVGDHLNVNWWDCYDMLQKPSSMTRKRRRQVEDALGIEPKRYWRPCLPVELKEKCAGISLEQLIEDMLQYSPHYSSSD